MKIPILYEEPHFLLVDKPAGLLTQAVVGVENLQAALIEQLKQRDNHPGQPFVGLPHRLDRGTSGVLLIARNQRALKRFGDQFHHRLVQKQYLAWVEGEMDLDGAVLTDYVRKMDGQAMAEIVEQQAVGARLAELHIQRVAICQGQTLALIRLLTGRMHQIRLQLASRGWPVVGDKLYGSQLELVQVDDPRQLPQGLHAWRLEFRHPQSAKKMVVSAPLPSYWQANDGLYQAAIILDQQAKLHF